MSNTKISQNSTLLAISLVIVSAIVFVAWQFSKPGESVNSAQESSFSNNANDLNAVITSSNQSAEQWIDSLEDQDSIAVARLLSRKSKLDLDRLEKVIAKQEVQVNLSHTTQRIADLEARLSALPEPSSLLDPGRSTEQYNVAAVPRVNTPEWNAVMDNYSRQTGISRTEIDSLLKN